MANHSSELDADNPCRDCGGACCQFFRIAFYHGELDSQPFGVVPADMATQFSPHQACMNGTRWGHGRCIALTEGGKCSIYANRPSPCHEFPALIDGAPNPKCGEIQKIVASATMPGSAVQPDC